MFPACHDIVAADGEATIDCLVDILVLIFVQRFYCKRWMEYYRFSFEVFLFLRQEVHKLYYGGGRILPLVCCPRLLQGAPAPWCVVLDSCKVCPPPGVLFPTAARCVRPLV